MGEWFDQDVWADAVPISDDLLKRAEHLWKWRRAGRDGPGTSGHAGGSLLTALRSNPDWFKDKPFRVYIYEPDEFSPEAERGLQDIRSEYKALRYAGVLSAYENWKLDPGVYVLDFHLMTEPRRRVTLDGFWKVLTENSYRTLKNTSLTLCTKVEAFEGLTIEPDRVALNRAALQIANTAKGKVDIDLSAAEFGRWIADHS